MYKSANFESVTKQSSSIKRSILYSSPFGSSIPELQYAYSEGADTSKYRFGFNTQERDDELFGKGNSFSAEFWQYDSRLGRRFNIDPVYKYYTSPYACLGNNPIHYVDPDGKDTFVMQLTHIENDNSMKTNVLLLQANFYLIQKGIWSQIVAPINSTGTNEIAFMMPEANWNGKNKLDGKDFYSAKWQGMASHPDWKNTILLQNVGRGQFAHPGSLSEHSAGCLIPCNPTLFVVYKKSIKDEHGIVSPGYFLIYGSDLKNSALSKEMLKIIHDLYNIAFENNSLSSEQFGFLVTMKDVSIYLELNTKNNEPDKTIYSSGQDQIWQDSISTSGEELKLKVK